tara:strand:- start:462 stop:1013 length:552 start_codon:yes stop_codon:yes gene_type:complete
MIKYLKIVTIPKLIFFGLLFSNYSHNLNYDSTDYDMLYSESQKFIELDNLENAIKSLDKIINKKRTYQKDDDILIMNSYYDLGQIYLSRSIDYEKATSYFEYIYNNTFSGYEVEIPSKLKSLSELKLKSLFMLGYIYHNHIGNYSIAEYYYSTFLNKYPNNELYESVEFELNIIKEEIANFKK